MKTTLKYLTGVIAGLALGISSESSAIAADDWSCCIYQGQYGLYCINWYSGNEVDCQTCPRGPMDCKFPGEND
jgi:hypothetical protein